MAIVAICLLVGFVFRRVTERGGGSMNMRTKKNIFTGCKVLAAALLLVSRYIPSFT